MTVGKLLLFPAPEAVLLLRHVTEACDCLALWSQTVFLLCKRKALFLLWLSVIQAAEAPRGQVLTRVRGSPDRQAKVIITLGTCRRDGWLVGFRVRGKDVAAPACHFQSESNRVGRAWPSFLSHWLAVDPVLQSCAAFQACR